MAAEMLEVEVWVLVNSEGEWVAHEDAGQLADAYGERIGELADAEGTRRVKLTVKIPLPKPIEIRGEVQVSEEPGELQAV